MTMHVVKLFFLILCTLGLWSLVVGRHACGCYCSNWEPWSTCSRTCGGGTQHRYRTVLYRDVPECDDFERCASNDMVRDDRACNTNCFNKGTIHFNSQSIYGYCQCPKGVKGRCCEQIVDCGKPSEVSNGRVVYTSTTYNNKAVVVCDADYNVTDISLGTRTCTEYGYWSGTSPQCLYAVSCKSDPCMNGAPCENTLGDYICSCRPGWTGKNCETDIQPPVVSDCPIDRENFTANMTSYQSWIAPQFSDPFGNKVTVTTNYPKHEYVFPWGAYTVHYTGIKENNGLQVECTFTVAIKPHPCTLLSVPTNGYVVCNGWRKEYAQVCKRLCFTGYSLPPGYTDDGWYNCGATGSWLPVTTEYGCVADSIAVNGNQPTNTLDVTDCKRTDEMISIQKYYIKELKLSALNGLCDEYSAECGFQNVTINC